MENYISSYLWIGGLVSVWFHLVYKMKMGDNYRRPPLMQLIISPIFWPWLLFLGWERRYFGN